MKKFLPLLLLLFIFSCSSSKKYAESSKVWEKEVAAIEKRDKNINYPPNSILFVGSSSIRLWNSIEKDMAPYTAIKNGVGGTRLSDIIYYHNRLIKPYKAQGVVIFVANDIHGSDQDRSPEEILKLYKKLVKKIKKSHKKTPIFFVEITPTESRWEVWPNTARANLLIKSYTKQHKNLYFIETAQSFIGKDGMPDNSLFVKDRLHLNEQGYQTWTNHIKSSLNRHLK